jgi:hypothetical protein
VNFNVLARAKAKGMMSEERKARSTSRRLSRIRSAVESMQGRIRRDLSSGDPNRFLTALAVGLMVETNEDPVGWRKKNVELGEEEWSATYRSAGKRRPIANRTIIQALQTAFETTEDDNDELFAHDTGRVTAEMVGDYLSRHKLSMKDIRGYNANVRMHSALNETRSAGQSLPTQRRARTKVLRAEFLKTLDKVADEVGLEADLIRFNYLDPGLESTYTTEGSTAVTKTASLGLAERVAARFLT